MTLTASDYTVLVTITDSVDNEGETCTDCGEAPVQATAYYHTDEPFEPHDHSRDTCLACVIPALDATPWLDTSRPVTVEVTRRATHRPF